jgi:hypothetical protein
VCYELCRCVTVSSCVLRFYFLYEVYLTKLLQQLRLYSVEWNGHKRMLICKGFGRRWSCPYFKEIARKFAICLEGLKKTMKNLSLNSRSPGRDLNTGPPEYEIWVLTTRPRCSLDFISMLKQRHIYRSTYFTFDNISLLWSTFFVGRHVFTNSHHQVCKLYLSHHTDKI